MSNSSLIVLSPSADTEGYFFYMLDGFSAVVKGVDMEALLQNPLLTWGRWTREDDRSSLSSYCRAHYRGVILKLFDSGILKINGSIHRFFNHGGPNTSIFTFSELSHAIYELCDLIGVQPEEVVLHRIEIGLNIYTGPILAGEVVESALLVKDKKFKPMSDIEGMQADFTDYRVKIYSKSSDLVRYEIAAKRIRYFSKFNISTLADFLDVNRYKSLFEFLVESFKKVVFFDKESAYVFSTETRWKYSTPDFWLTLNPYRRKVEYSMYLTYLRQAAIPYIGDTILDRLIDVWPSLIDDPKDTLSSLEEQPKDDLLFSTLGLQGKNENDSTPECIVIMGISSFASLGKSSAATPKWEYAGPGMCEGLRRARSPPNFTI